MSDSEDEDEDELGHPQRIEKKGDKVYNDLYFYAWDRKRKNQNHCIFQDNKIRIVPYSRASSKPSMNNVSATE